MDDTIDDTIDELRKIRKAVDKEYDGRFADYVKKLIEDQKSTKTSSNNKRIKKTLELTH
jgi:hypothetical protein